MSDIILKVSNINKQYRLGLVGTGTLSHDLSRWWHRIRGKEDPFLKVGEVNDRSTKGESDYVWALKDINFEVARGEVLGIIGKNGAGKSTLLKILSRVTGPTTGEIKTKGRIASLLEVGTGFHPELTGRENIYLNGAILGMTKSEIKAKEDEIIDFSGCARYIETPVKRYSSGMRVRLAFAVAAFLEPDILVIDEVLAVGDAEFQKKAVGKMQDISKGDGRTVIFVSHNMAAVKSLCTRAIVLSNGQLVYSGGTEESIQFYLQNGNEKGSDTLRYFSEELYNEFFQLKKTSIRAVGKEIGEPIDRNDTIVFSTLISNSYPKNLYLVYRFKDAQGDYIFVSSSAFSDFKLDFEGEKEVLMTIPSHFFNEGSIYVDVMLSNGRKVLFKEEDALCLIIVQEERELGEWMGRTPGALKPQFKWELSN
ncbi:ABC transporter ATP-binding protein [Psychroserpens sp. SPM9]|uniref:ABC transporter ATP-binding protein n=1 Tax=Psychroserpens sp. SPM9 TaxID=2975598 RepID=UPI0021A6A137|nr:ABC transporter ATP-binding protein [Psychroserpens sp. SPM9]MDG5492253.1 ABC transporter ATP-binding protein [Psychroserpens sp. SPM9]